MQIIKYQDYIDTLHGEFPLIEKKSIEEILKYGTNLMLHYRKRDLDLYFKDDVNLKFFMFAGDITKDPYKRTGIYFKKKRKKVRHMYVLDKRVYDGYYYFGVYEEDFKTFMETKKVRKVHMCKVHEECYVNPRIKHIFRVPVETPTKWCYPFEGEILNAEYIQVKEGTEFKDI